MRLPGDNSLCRILSPSLFHDVQRPKDVADSATADVVSVLRGQVTSAQLPIHLDFSIRSMNIFNIYMGSNRYVKGYMDSFTSTASRRVLLI